MMASGSKRLNLTKPGLLLCEGRDEKAFFEAWFLELGIADSVDVVPFEGKAKLTEFLADLSKVSGLAAVKQIAITRDADEDAAAAVESVRYSIAQGPEVIQTLRPTSFVLPDNSSAGSLESLWLASLEAEPMAPCIEEFFRCIEVKGWQPSQSFSKNDKTRAQLWIATKDTPNERFGHAAWHGRRNTDQPYMREKWIDFNHEAFRPLREFLLANFRR